MVFIAKLQKIIQVAMAFLDSMMAIANGALGAAAAKVESTLAGLLTLAISFLAGFLGLGKIADKVMNIINTKVRAPVDKAIDFVINWIVTTAKSLFKALFGKKDAKPDTRTDAQKQADLQSGLSEADAILQDQQTPLSKLKKKLGSIKSKYKMTSLEFVIVTENHAEGTETVQAVGEINPRGTKPPKPHNLRELVASLDPINVKYAGHTVEITSGPLKGTKVAYDSLGFPDFSAYSIATVTIQMHGNRSYRDPDGDFGNANVKAGYARNGGEPRGHTWHHHQDRRTMQLVPTKIHDAFRHSGGVWVIDQVGEK